MVMPNFKNDVTKELFEVFFELAFYTNHLSRQPSDEFAELLNLPPLDPLVKQKRLLIEEIMKCFLETDIKPTGCNSGAFAKWAQLNKTFISRFNHDGKSVQFKKEDLDAATAHIEKEQKQDVNDAQMLANTLNAATNADIQPLIRAFQQVLTPANISILETRRSHILSQDSLLNKALDAIYDLVNWFRNNLSGGIKGKEITLKVGRLFELTNDEPMDGSQTSENKSDGNSPQPPQPVKL